jgi:hypothetical protein
MSILPINKDTYFRQNIYLTTINIGTKPFINIKNMSVNGDISMNSLHVTNTLNTPLLKSNKNTLIQFNNPIYNNSTKTSTSIGYSVSVNNNTTTYTMSALGSKVTPITVTGLPAGVYIFTYYYNIGLIVPFVYVTIYQLYNYIDNITTGANLLTKNVSLIHGQNINQADTTYGVLTGASNTITFGISCLGATNNNNFTFNTFNLRYTRLA